MTATAQPDTLFSLSAEMRALDELLTESAGEVTPEVSALLSHLQGKIEHKADSCAWYLKTLEAELSAATEHAAHFATKQLVARRKIEAWKAYLSMCLTNLGTDKLEGTAYRVDVVATSKRTSTVSDSTASAA